MKLIAFCVRRPIFITMIVFIALLLGISSYRRIPVDLMPEIENPTITVSVNYENASPEEMETLVAEYVENAVVSAPGVKEVTSTSGEGVTNIRVTFNWGTDLDAATNDLRDRLDRVIGDLPEDADRPQIRKFDIARFPIVVLGVAGDIDPVELRQIVDNQIRYRIEQIDGVAEADIFGGFEREIQVNLDLEKIKALSIPLNTILDQIRQANINVPAGSVERGNYDVTLRTPGEFTNLDQLRDLVVATRRSAPVRLAQIAEIKDTHTKFTRVIRVNGQQAIRLGVRKQTGANTVAVANAVVKEVERLNKDIPAVNITTVLDTSQFIQRSIANVQSSVLIGGVLAVIVLLAFLRNFRSTFVIATAIPTSIIATFSLIYFNGFTLNLMTLGGLALGVGMMVDNSIVVLENIFRIRHEENMDGDPDGAAIKGASEVWAAVLASTLTTLVIFLPMLFVQGVTGQIFGQLGVVIVFALLCSLTVAVTLVPMLSAKFLKPAPPAHNPVKAAALRAFERFFTGMEKIYAGILGEALRARGMVILVILLIFASCIALAPQIGVEFMPTTDQGDVRVNMEMEVGTKLDLVDQQMKKIEEIVRNETPEMASNVVSIGSNAFRPSDRARGSINITLVPRRERQRSSEDIANALRPKLQNIPGAVVRTRAGEGLRVLNLGANEEDNVTVEIRGYDLATLDALAAEAQAALTSVEGITDARMSRDPGAPQELVHINRDRAADLNISVSEVARALETSVAGSRAGFFREAGDEFRILVKLHNAELLGLDQILDLTIMNSAGQAIALRNAVDVESGTGPNLIERKNQERIVYVTGNVTNRDLGSVLADVQARLDQIPRPIGYEMRLGGDFEEQRQAFIELLISLAVAILLVYMVLACLYESLVDPLIVMASVPMAGIGVILILFLTGTTLNTQSFIGCIMLAGIVVNNAVLIVDQAGQLRHLMTAREAVLEAGRRRLRPILMTTLTTVCGLLPLALGVGDGAEAQAPLARAVIGGLLSSTFITLVLIPVIYSIVHRRRIPSAAAAPAVAESPKPRLAEGSANQ